MKNRDLVNLLLSYLDSDLLNYSLFKDFRDKYLDIDDSALIIGNILLSEDFYEQVVREHPEVIGRCAKGFDKTFRLCYSLGLDSFIIDIILFNEYFKVKVKCTEKNKVQEVSLEKYEDVCLAIATEEIHNGPVCEDYKCEVACYDLDGEMYPMDTEELADTVFSERFLVPLDMARFLRTNFKTFKDKINRYHAIKDSKSYDDILDSDELCSFKGPFVVGDFKNSITSYLKSEIYEDLKEAGYEDPDLLMGRYPKEYILDKLDSNLMCQVGEGEIVISTNIVDLLSAILDDFVVDALYTDGIAIKKQEDSYILYYAHFENESIVLVPQEISREEAQELFYKGIDNQKNPLLKDFFGINRGR